MTDSLRMTDIIRRRYSCRSYSKAPIEPSTRQQLETAISGLAPGPFHSSSRFALAAAASGDQHELRGLGTYGFIRGAQAYIIGAATSSPMDMEDFGYRMETLVLDATRLGLGTCWLGGTFTRSSFMQKISAGQGEKIPAVCAVGYPSHGPDARGRSPVDATIRRQVRAADRLDWEKIFFDGETGRPLTPESAGLYATPLEMVRRGPSGSNKQPWRVVKDGRGWHFYMVRTPGYREMFLARLVGVLDIQRIDLGIAMCHFERSAQECGLLGRWERSDPAPAAIPGTRMEYTASWIPAEGSASGVA